MIKVTITNGESKKVINVETGNVQENNTDSNKIQIKAKVINRMDDKEFYIKDSGTITEESNIEVKCKITEENNNDKENVIEVNPNVMTDDRPKEVNGVKIVEEKREDDQIIKVNINKPNTQTSSNNNKPENNKNNNHKEDTFHLIDEYEKNKKENDKNNKENIDKQDNKNKGNFEEIVNNSFIPESEEEKEEDNDF